MNNVNNIPNFRKTRQRILGAVCTTKYSQKAKRDLSQKDEDLLQTRLTQTNKQTDKDKSS